MVDTLILLDNNSQTANVTYVLGKEMITQQASFSISVTQESINFMLTGSWSSNDGGTASYYAANGRTEDDNDRNATSLPVEGVFLIAQARDVSQRIWTCDGCNLTVRTRGTTVTYPAGCSTYLEFPEMDPVSADTVGVTVTSANNPFTFKINSRCVLGYVVLSYQQGYFPATTTTSPTTSAPASGASESTQSSTLRSSSTSTSPTTSASDSAAFSGENPMTRCLVTSIAMALTIIQWQ
ncbi:unnamed protein product [Calicophoron daubneyi]|uniref:Uncharacterized protein n=1 Tax=Calicophoron daubneyi TaxID=300641 RepID=A0AAV2TUW0_CALDB